MRAVFRVGGGEALTGKVVELTAYGCAVLLEADAAALFAEGDELPLSFDCLLLLTPIRTRAKVLSAVRDGDVARCSFEFVDSDGLLRQVPYVLRRDFTRRMAPRVRPGEHIRILIQPREARRRIEASLVDISVGGLAVEVPPPDAATILGWSSVRISFRLNGYAEPFRLIGEVRHCRESDLTCTVSLEFDAAESPEFETQQSSIGLFVVERTRGAEGAARP